MADDELRWEIFSVRVLTRKQEEEEEKEFKRFDGGNKLIKSDFSMETLGKFFSEG